MSHKSRKFKNLLLDPMIQMKIGIISILMSVFFGLGVGGVVFYKFNPLMQNILDLTDVPEELKDIIRMEWNDALIWLVAAFVIYVLLIILISVWYTHRMVGPIVAFKRHIDNLKNGNYLFQTVLRKGDAFSDLGEKLNELSEKLRQKGG